MESRRSGSSSKVRMTPFEAICACKAQGLFTNPRRGGLPSRPSQWAGIMWSAAQAHSGDPPRRAVARAACSLRRGVFPTLVRVPVLSTRPLLALELREGRALEAVPPPSLAAVALPERLLAAPALPEVELDLGHPRFVRTRVRQQHRAVQRLAAPEQVAVSVSWSDADSVPIACIAALTRSFCSTSSAVAPPSLSCGASAVSLWRCWGLSSVRHSQGPGQGGALLVVLAAQAACRSRASGAITPLRWTAPESRP